jgi:Fe-S oxidoreductase
MAKIKTEFLAHYNEEHGVPLRTKVFANIHASSKLASHFPKLANAAMQSPMARMTMAKIGIAPERTPSLFADQTFEAWWEQHAAKRDAEAPRPTRGQVVYFHDTFTTYNYPRIGRAVVRLLEAAGYEVLLETRRACCGRPMLSKGLVNEAREFAKVNVDLLAPYARRGIPIVGSEPSCILTLRDEYVDLLPGNANAAHLAANSYMIDEFLAKIAGTDGLGIVWRDEPREVFFHGHCHQKALIGMQPSMAILKQAGITARESGAGCCGMAGSFGYETEHYEVSRKVGEERLFPRVRTASQETTIAVAGVSCHQQIEHFTGRATKHIAEVLAEQVKPGHQWRPELVAQEMAAD